VREDKQTRLEQFKVAKKKMDDDDIEYFEEDLRKVGKIENWVMEIAGVLVHVYRGAVSQSFIEALLPHFAVTLSNFNGKKDYEIRKISLLIIYVVNAVCFFCDVVESGGDDIFGLTASKAAEKFLECIKAFPEDRGLIQSAGYGLGSIAKRIPRGSFTHLPQTLQTFKGLLDDPTCRTDEEKAESTDNIIGALGKCMLFHYDGQLLTLPAVKEYLSLLPLYTDSEEAQSVHKLLFE